MCWIEGSSDDTQQRSAERKGTLRGIGKGEEYRWERIWTSAMGDEKQDTREEMPRNWTEKKEKETTLIINPSLRTPVLQPLPHIHQNLPQPILPIIIWPLAPKRIQRIRINQLPLPCPHQPIPQIRVLRKLVQQDSLQHLEVHIRPIGPLELSQSLACRIDIVNVLDFPNLLSLLWVVGQVLEGFMEVSGCWVHPALIEDSVRGVVEESDPASRELVETDGGCVVGCARRLIWTDCTVGVCATAGVSSSVRCCRRLGLGLGVVVCSIGVIIWRSDVRNRDERVCRGNSLLLAGPLSFFSTNTGTNWTLG